MTPVLLTDRLALTALERGHFAALVDLWSDPEVTRYMGGPRDRATLPAAFEEDLGSTDAFDLWPLLQKSTGELVGFAGIIPKQIADKDEHELIYVLARSAWGQGIATEIATALIGHADRQLQLTRLVALINPENNASAHVAKKTGFVLERTVDRDVGHQKHLYAGSLAQPETAV